MPEPYWPKHRKKNSYTLSDAAKNSRYARLRCAYCKRELWFLVSDLIRIFGGDRVRRRRVQESLALPEVWLRGQ